MKKISVFLFVIYVLATTTAGAATIIVPASTTTTITGNYSGDDYIVFGTLQFTNPNVQVNGSIVVNAGGVVNTTGNFIKYGSSLTINQGALFTTAGNFTAGVSTTLQGILTVGGTLTLTSGPVTLACPGQIYTQNFINNSGPNVIAGSGYIEITGSFTGSNPLTASSQITINAAGGTGNPGNATPGTKATACNGSLPVNFGTLQASVSANQLTVHWTTLSETNNDHFEIEASADGRNFHKIGEDIASKNENGNASSATNYSVNIPASSLLSVTALALLAVVLGFRRNRTLPKVYTVIAIALLTLLGYSCSKSSGEINRSDVQDLYVRVIQIDKDGSRKASDIVKAIKE